MADKKRQYEDWSRIGCQCPFYKKENRSKIVCSGVGDIASLHITFAVPQDKKLYQQRYCDKDWCECCVAKILESEEE